MNILFFVLNLIILNFIKQINCLLNFNNIAQIIYEREFSSCSLFTKFNSSHILGILNNKIYLISPSQVKNVGEISEEISEPTKIKILDKNSFALILVEKKLIGIYNINENEPLFFNYDWHFYSDAYAVEYEGNKFYISHLINDGQVIIEYIIVKYEGNEFNIVKNIVNENLPSSGKYNIFNFNNKTHNFIIIIIKNDEYRNLGKVLNEVDSQILSLYIIYKEKNSEEKFNIFLNQPIDNFEIIDGFKLDDNNFIIYGLSDENNIIIININFITKNLNWYSFTLLDAGINKDTFSIFLNNKNQIYISFYVPEYFYIALISLEEEETNLQFNQKFFISDIFYPYRMDYINYLKGFFLQNILIFILKNEREEQINLKMITFRNVTCGYIYENDIKTIEVNKIINTKNNDNSLSVINIDGININQNFPQKFSEEVSYEIKLYEEIINFSTNYLSYITGFINEGKDEFQFCDFKLTRCHKSCLCTECTHCNNEKDYYEIEDGGRLRCGFYNTQFEKYYFNKKQLSTCNNDCKYCEDNNECNEYNEFSFEKYDPKFSIPGRSKINLGKCEDILKDFYQIPKSANLYIKKNEIIIENKPTKTVEYEVYDKDMKQLNLSLCENETIKISSPIVDKNLIKFDYGKRLNNKGIDIYNSSDEYFNDYCNNIDIDLGTDIPINDRKKDIYVNISLCKDGCIYDGINYETELIDCKCDKSLLNNIKDEKESNVNKIIEKISNKINYKIVTCYKYIFDFSNLKNNYAFLFCSSVFIVLNIFTILHFTKTFSLLTKKVYNSMYLPKEHSTILHNKQQFKPSPIKKKNKKIENKDYDQILKDSNIHSSRINHGSSSSFRELNLLKNKKVQQKKNKNNYFKIKKSKKKNFINDDIIIKPKEKEEEKDYDEMYYYEASKEDERNLIHITFSNFISKIDLIEILFFPEPYNILFVTLSGYLFSLMIDFTLNSLLFSDDVLSTKYHSKNNTLNFALSELLSIISNVIGNILSYLILKMTNYSFAFETVEKEVKDNEEILEIFNKFRKIIKIRLTFYFIIQFICMCAFIYYLKIFCALYKYSQRALFKNYFLGLLTSLFYTLLISIFISLLRYLSLKCGSKKIFMTSKYLNEKL